jgi:rifampin ADP-ribosylating transferase
MEFSQNNPVVKYCLEGIAFEGRGQPAAASGLYLRAWNEASHDFEKFTAAYFLARHQQTVADRLHWLKTTLEHGLKVHDARVKPAFSGLYFSIAECYEALHDDASARAHYDLSRSLAAEPDDQGPFYHGTRADLQFGELLTAGYHSNYKPGLKMNHIYFTASVNGAGLAAALSKGAGWERVYLVEPTGRFENDPNVTNQKFPGNPTRSYRTEAPLKIVGEVTDWMAPTAEDLQRWREKLANSAGEIIN